MMFDFRIIFMQYFLKVIYSLFLKKDNQHCVKSVRIWSFPAPTVPAFRLNKFIPNAGNVDQKTPNTDTFYAVQFTSNVDDTD